MTDAYTNPFDQYDDQPVGGAVTGPANDGKGPPEPRDPKTPPAPTQQASPQASGPNHPVEVPQNWPLDAGAVPPGKKPDVPDIWKTTKPNKAQRDAAGLPDIPDNFPLQIDEDPAIAGAQVQAHVNDALDKGEARDKAALDIFGRWGDLDEKGQKDAIENELSSAKASQSFWQGTHDAIAKVRSSGAGNATADVVSAIAPQPLAQSINALGQAARTINPDADTPADDVLGWAQRTAAAKVAFQKRREDQALQMKEGKLPGPTKTVLRNDIENLAQEFGSGVGSGVSGGGDFNRYAADKIFGDGPKDRFAFAPADWQYSERHQAISEQLWDAYHETEAREGSLTGKAAEITMRAGSVMQRQLGDFIIEKSRELFPEDEARQDELQVGLAKAAGGLMSFIGPSMTASFLTKLSSKGLIATARELGDRELLAAVEQTVERDAGNVATTVATATSAASTLEQTAEEARQKGALPEEESDAALWGGLIGTSAMIPIAPLFKSPTGSAAGRILGESAMFSTQNAGMTLANNVVAQHYYDPERRWDDGLWDSMATGFILGAATEGARSTYHASKTALKAALAGEKADGGEPPADTGTGSEPPPGAPGAPGAGETVEFDGKTYRLNPDGSRGPQVFFQPPSEDRPVAAMTQEGPNAERPAEAAPGVNDDLDRDFKEVLQAVGESTAEAETPAGISPESPDKLQGNYQRFDEVSTPDGSVKLPVRQELVELADLKAQKKPGALQPRDRTTAQSKEQVAQRAAALSPDRLMPRATSSGGAPIVMPDGTVLSGNGRTLSLQEAYRNPDLKAQADAYRAALGPEAAGMKEPVLISRITKEMPREQLSAFAEASNRPTETVSDTDKSRFVDLISSSVPQAEWQERLGVDDKTLQGLVNWALDGQILRRSPAGSIRRTGKVARDGEGQEQARQEAARQGRQKAAGERGRSTGRADEDARGRDARKHESAIPNAFSRRAAANARNGRVASYKPRKAVADAWKKNGVDPTEFQELAPTHAADFHAALSAAKAASPYGPAVQLKPIEKYAAPGMRLFLEKGGKAGFALDGDNLVSVFKHPTEGPRKATVPMLALAVHEGARRLDAFDTQLPHLYSVGGFKAVARTAFVDEYAPEGWDYNRFATFNGGRPDAVFMVYDPSAPVYKAGDGERVDSYDEGSALAESIARNAEGQGSPIDLFRREQAARDFMATPEWLGAGAEVGSDTSKQEGFGGPEWKANREYVAEDGSKIKGWDAAVAHIAAKAESEVPGGPARERKAYILMGYPAAGKSSIANKIRDLKRAMIVDPDDGKVVVPEYGGGWNSSGVHVEGQKLSNEVLARSMREGYNVIIPKLGSSDNSIIAPSQALRDKGYTVHVVHVDVPKPIAMERAIARWRNTGRTVPVDVYDNLDAGKTYDSVKAQGAVDGAFSVKWNEPGGWDLTDDTGEVQGLRFIPEGRTPTRDSSVGNTGVGGSDQYAGDRGGGELGRGASFFSSAPEGRLTLSAEDRIDGALRAREAQTGSPVSQDVADYAARLEGARGSKSRFDPILAEIKSDRSLSKADLHDLAALSGMPIAKGATKAAAIAALVERHDRAVRDLSRAPGVATLMGSILGGPTPGELGLRYNPALDMSPEARKARAEARGYDTSRVWYHGTNNDFEAFRPSKSGYVGPGIYLAKEPDTANIYAGEWHNYEEGGNVLPLYVRKGPLADTDQYYDLIKSDTWDSPALSPEEAVAELQRQGYVGIGAQDDLIATIFHPNDVHSVNAAFDPAQEGNPNLMLSAVAAQPDERTAATNRLRDFGFPNVQLGDTPQSVEAAKHTANTLSVLSQITGIPAKAMGALTNPSLGILVREKSLSSILGFYQAGGLLGMKPAEFAIMSAMPDVVTHEFGHLLDNAAGVVGHRRYATEKNFTESLRTNFWWMTPKVQDGFQALSDIFADPNSELASTSARIDKHVDTDRAARRQPAKGTYMAQPTEMFARSFEYYVRTKAAEMGLDIGQVQSPVRLGEGPVENLPGYSGEVKSPEAQKLIAAFDSIFAGVRDNVAAGRPATQYLAAMLGGRGAESPHETFDMLNRAIAESGEEFTPQQRADETSAATLGAFIGTRGAGQLALAGRPAAKAGIKMAMQMVKEGKSKDEIWDATSKYFADHDPDLIGAFTGADGQWRVESSDAAFVHTKKSIKAFNAGKQIGRAPKNAGEAEIASHMQTFDEDTQSPLAPINLEDVVSHPTVYQAYPELGSSTGASVRPIEKPLPSGIHGATVHNAEEAFTDVFNRPLTKYKDLIHVNAKSPAQSRSVFGHEIQHLIQGEEGHNFGGSQQTVPEALKGGEAAPWRAALEHLAQLASSIEDRLDALHRGEPIAVGDPRYPEVDQLRQGLNKVEHVIYQMLAGEVEARNAQARLAMTPEERRATPPWHTEDFARKHQLVITQEGRAKPTVSYQTDGGYDWEPRLDTDLLKARLMKLRHFTLGNAMRSWFGAPEPEDISHLIEPRPEEAKPEAATTPTAESASGVPGKEQTGAAKPESLHETQLPLKLGKPRERQLPLRVVGGKSNRADTFLKMYDRLSGEPERIAPMTREAQARVADEIRKALPRDVAVRVLDRLNINGVSALGSSNAVDRVLAVSMSQGEGIAREIGRHEIIHMLRELDLFEPQEWQALLDHASKIGAAAGIDMKAPGALATGLGTYRQYYTEQLSQMGYRGAQLEARVNEMLDQELVAKMAEGYVDGARYGSKIDRLMERMRRFFEAVTNAFRSAFGMDGKLSPETVMAHAFSGEIAQRAEQARAKARSDRDAEMPRGLSDLLEELRHSNTGLPFAINHQGGIVAPASVERSYAGPWVIRNTSGGLHHDAAGNPVGFESALEALAYAEQHGARIDDAGQMYQSLFDDLHMHFDTSRMLGAFTAYSGSGADFDQFDWSKIGEGGSTALYTPGIHYFGYGHNFASQQPVAAEYHRQFATDLYDDGPENIEDPTHQAARALKEESGDREAAAQRLLGRADNEDGNVSRAPMLSGMRGYHKNWAKIYREAARVVAAGQEAKVRKSGGVYEAKIDVDDDQLLDLDKPISQQSPVIQEIARQAIEQNKARIAVNDPQFMARIAAGQMDGYGLMRALGGNTEEVSKKLDAAGVHGARYSDIYSSSGPGTPNYVIFNDDVIKITGKNGKPVPAATRNKLMRGPIPIKGSGQTLGAIVGYHGTPHDWQPERLVRLANGHEMFVGLTEYIPPDAKVLKEFPAGRPRMDKMGTGEGAQAFGPGFYIADRAKLGEHYYKTLAARDNPRFRKAGPRQAAIRVNAQTFEEAQQAELDAAKAELATVGHDQKAHAEIAEYARRLIDPYGNPKSYHNLDASARLSRWLRDRGHLDNNDIYYPGASSYGTIDARHMAALSLQHRQGTPEERRAAAIAERKKSIADQTAKLKTLGLFSGPEKGGIQRQINESDSVLYHLEQGTELKGIPYRDLLEQLRGHEDKARKAGTLATKISLLSGNYGGDVRFKSSWLREDEGVSELEQYPNLAAWKKDNVLSDGTYLGGPDVKRAIAELEQLQAEGKASWDVLSDADRAKAMAGGGVLQLAVNAEPSEILDWDRAVNEQHPEVRKKLRKAKLTSPNALSWLGSMVGKPTKGGDIVHSGQQRLGAEGLRQALVDQGVKAIRYLAGGHRTPGATPSYNYVILDDKAADVTHKNGVPITALQRQDAIDQMRGGGQGQGQTMGSFTAASRPAPAPTSVTDGLDANRDSLTTLLASADRMSPQQKRSALTWLDDQKRQRTEDGATVSAKCLEQPAGFSIVDR